MNFVVIVGSSGRMSQLVQSLCSSRKLPFKLFSPNAKDDLRVDDFKGASGVIDFSLPPASRQVARRAVKANIPWVCGTTGWANEEEFKEIIVDTSKSIPIVYDSNFSLGIELLCQMSELLAVKVGSPMAITDIHHVHKRDAPSGTALKLQHRIHAKKPEVSVQVDSIRIGEVPGEHKVLVSFQNETIEITHRAFSREPFASGALKALNWVQGKSAGLYTMKDVLS